METRNPATLFFVTISSIETNTSYYPALAPRLTPTTKVITSCDNQPDGKGELKQDDGTVFLPNDTYELTKETFRLYYTSQSEDQQVIDIYFSDNFGNGDKLSFTFSDNNSEDSDL